MSTIMRSSELQGATTAPALLLEQLRGAVDDDTGRNFRDLGDMLTHGAEAACSAAKLLVEEVLCSDSALARTAALSYEHVLGFDKIVLHRSNTSEASIRLHYWSANRNRGIEDVHNHRFPFYSCVLAGEVTSIFYEQCGDGIGENHRRMIETSSVEERRWAYEFGGIERMRVVGRQTHVAPDSYSLSEHQLHRIEVSPDQETLTMVVHSGLTKFDSTVYRRPDTTWAGQCVQTPIPRANLSEKLEHFSRLLG